MLSSIVQTIKKSTGNDNMNVTNPVTTSSSGENGQMKKKRLTKWEIEDHKVVFEIIKCDGKPKTLQAAFKKLDKEMSEHTCRKYLGLMKNNLKNLERCNRKVAEAESKKRSCSTSAQSSDNSAVKKAREQYEEAAGIFIKQGFVFTSNSLDEQDLLKTGKALLDRELEQAAARIRHVEKEVQRSKQKGDLALQWKLVKNAGATKSQRVQADSEIEDEDEESEEDETESTNEGVNGGENSHNVEEDESEDESGELEDDDEKEDDEEEGVDEEEEEDESTNAKNKKKKKALKTYKGGEEMWQEHLESRQNNILEGGIIGDFLKGFRESEEKRVKLDHGIVGDFLKGFRESEEKRVKLDQEFQTRFMEAQAKRDNQMFELMKQLVSREKEKS